MALEIEYLNTEELVTYERNARVHSQEQLDQIGNAILEFGFTNPVLVDNDNVLIAGHARLAAAAQIGLESVPAIRLSNLTPKQIKALRIADNQLALNASWDLELLEAEVESLQGDDFDMDLLGFDEDFLSGLLSDDPDTGEVDEDEDDEQQPAAGQESVAVVVGPYEIKVKRGDWDRWETQVRAKVGFDKDDIVAEIQKRLGL